ncbi:MAG: dinitrogenase iron-molybdenum cofactor, partial [Clostridiales bacterium]|nr:dinitrogenase iron-molybdenum cofactor [Clostridiales bacterium]
MKIAVASEGKYVSEHFGHCEGFTFYEVKEDEVVKKDFKQNPG